LSVCLAAALGGGLLGWISYSSAVRAATAFGSVIRAVVDLYRRDLIAKLAFRPPSDNEREIELWEAVAKFIVNGGVDSEQEKLLKYKDSSTN
jgi:hypothetical protein